MADQPKDDNKYQSPQTNTSTIQQLPKEVQKKIAKIFIELLDKHGGDEAVQSFAAYQQQCESTNMVCVPRSEVKVGDKYSESDIFKMSVQELVRRDRRLFLQIGGGVLATLLMGATVKVAYDYSNSGNNENENLKRAQDVFAGMLCMTGGVGIVAAAVMVAAIYEYYQNKKEEKSPKGKTATSFAENVNDAKRILDERGNDGRS